MLDFFRIRLGLNKHTNRSARAIGLAQTAAKELEIVNNGLITMDADLDKKIEMLGNISSNVKEKVEENKQVIDALKKIQA
jgi:hypothetical protein